MSKMKTMACAVVCAAGLNSLAAAQGVQTFRDTLSIPFSIGTGNSNTNFSINRYTETGGNIVEIGMKAKERWFGDANVGGANELYIVQEGFSPTSGSNPTPSTRAWWNYESSINLGSRVTDSVRVQITIANLASPLMPPALVLSTTTDAAVGPLPSGISVLQSSENLDFSPFNFLTAWDAFDHGDYNFELEVFDKATNDSLGATNMTVRVVPAPSGAAVLALGGLVATRRRRS